MKNTKTIHISIAMLFMLVLVVGLTGAQETIEEATENIGELKGDAGTTPDSAFYGFERALEGISLAFTFNEQKKVEKRFNYANERLLEAKETAEKGSSEGTEKALNAHNKIMEKIGKSVNKSEEGESAEEINNSLDRAVGLQRAIEVHEYKTEVLQEKLSENISEEKREAIERALNNTKKSTQVLKRNLERKTQNTATRFRAVSEMNESRAEKAMEQVEKRKGLQQAKRSIATDKVQRTQKGFGQLEEKFQKMEGRGLNTSGSEEKFQEIREKLQKREQNISERGFEGSSEKLDADLKGLKKASEELERVMETANENASEGLQTALENLERSSDGLGKAEKSRRRAGQSDEETEEDKKVEIQENTSSGKDSQTSENSPPGPPTDQ